MFGSMMLTRYHTEFARAVPAGVPPGLLTYFSNPLLLVQMRPQIEATVAHTPGGPAALQALFAAVRMSLAHGLELVFFWSAMLMAASVLLHLGLRSQPLRTRMAQPDTPIH
jgi:hypothetical protein